MSTEIIERIKKEIASLDSAVTTTEIGVVTNVGDGIAAIEAGNFFFDSFNDFCTHTCNNYLTIDSYKFFSDFL